MALTTSTTSWSSTWTQGPEFMAPSPEPPTLTTVFLRVAQTDHLPRLSLLCQPLCFCSFIIHLLLGHSLVHDPLHLVCNPLHLGLFPFLLQLLLFLPLAHDLIV